MSKVKAPEKRLSLSELAALIAEREGVTIYPGSIHNWINRGVKGVMLEAVRVGSKYFTTWTAYLTFNAAINAPKK